MKAYMTLSCKTGTFNSVLDELILNTQPRNLEQVQQQLQNIPKVLSADTVFGPYDVICAVRANDKEDLKQLISQIQKEVTNIQGTVTAIVASIY